MALQPGLCDPREVGLRPGGEGRGRPLPGKRKAAKVYPGEGPLSLTLGNAHSSFFVTSPFLSTYLSYLFSTALTLHTLVAPSRSLHLHQHHHLHHHYYTIITTSPLPLSTALYLLHHRGTSQPPLLRPWMDHHALAGSWVGMGGEEGEEERGDALRGPMTARGTRKGHCRHLLCREKDDHHTRRFSLSLTPPSGESLPSALSSAVWARGYLSRRFLFDSLHSPWRRPFRRRMPARGRR